MCVLQVSNRDQAILKLQTELDTSQQKYTGVLEEVSRPSIYSCRPLYEVSCIITAIYTLPALSYTIKIKSVTS